MSLEWTEDHSNQRSATPQTGTALVPARQNLPAPLSPIDFDRTLNFKRTRIHSFQVRFLRWLFPLVGLVALSAVVFWTSIIPNFGINLGPDIKLDDYKLSFNGTSIVMDNPKLSGFGENGQAYEVTASSATQSVISPNIMNLEGLFAKISLDDGVWAHVKSAAGVFNNDLGSLSLPEEITLDSSEGYQMRLQKAEVDLKAGTLISQERVEVRSDTGLMQSNGIIVDQNGKRIRFTGGVRVTIVPPENGGRLIVE